MASSLERMTVQPASPPLAVWALAVLLSVLSMFPAPALAQDAGLTQKHHPWGCFSPGAWSTVRATFETLDSSGAVVSASTSETKTTLEKIEPDGVTLSIETTGEVAGKRLEGEPQTVKQGFYGELATQKTKVKQLEPATLEVLGQAIPCKVQQFEFEGAGATGNTTTIYYSDTVWPYVLKRQTVSVDPETKQRTSRTTIAVEALDMPWKVSNEIKGAACLRALHEHPKGITVTLAFTSPDVPGGVVYHTSKELNSDGQLVRRSILELVDYGLEKERLRIFPYRLRPGRPHR